MLRARLDRLASRWPLCALPAATPASLSCLTTRPARSSAYCQRSRTLRRHRYDTLAEGIGLDRVTRNFDMGLDSIDCVICVSDQEALGMAHWLLCVEGL